ncbi:MAG TPA: flavin prenyltransferase UbiX [Abditibacteriaceae bacterium]|jgi:4-hydroxy-3-polyprenylbenzoate decarboxylase
MKFIVALTGASGHRYALRLLQHLAQAGHKIALVVSEPACIALAAETGIKLNAHSFEAAKLFDDESLAANVTVFSPRAIGAAIASGSNPHDGMVVVPCSMGTLGRIAHGVSDDLVARAADVCLKERRKLILVAREMPLSLIHLENMVAATRAGAMILPACPHFYHEPQTPDAIVDTVVDRILDQLGAPRDTKRWQSDVW